MSWDPRDDDPPKKVTIYRNSSSLCDCEMCTEDPAEETELEIEDFE